MGCLPLLWLAALFAMIDWLFIGRAVTVICLAVLLWLALEFVRRR